MALRDVLHGAALPGAECHEGEGYEAHWLAILGSGDGADLEAAPRREFVDCECDGFGRVRAGEEVDLEVVEVTAEGDSGASGGCCKGHKCTAGDDAGGGPCPGWVNIGKDVL